MLIFSSNAYIFVDFVIDIFLCLVYSNFYTKIAIYVRTFILVNHNKPYTFIFLCDFITILRKQLEIKKI